MTNNSTGRETFSNPCLAIQAVYINILEGLLKCLISSFLKMRQKSCVMCCQFAVSLDENFMRKAKIQNMNHKSDTDTPWHLHCLESNPLHYLLTTMPYIILCITELAPGNGQSPLLHIWYQYLDMVSSVSKIKCLVMLYLSDNQCINFT